MATRLLQAGLKVSAPKTSRTGPPGVPKELRMKPVAGGAEVRWKSPMRRSLFFLQYREDSPQGEKWISPENSTAIRTRFTFRNLKPGVLYWFRVQAYNPNGKSGWSNPTSARPL